MKRISLILAMLILLAGLVPTALAQGPVGTTPDETATSRAAGPTESPGDAGVDAMRILDDFNRADGPIGAHWTVHGGDCTVSNNAAVCGGQPGWATFNGAPGNGDVAEADVAVDGTDLQYTGLLLNYGAGVDNLFIKVQQQAPYAGQFTHAACYTGNGSGSFGLGFFPLDAQFSTAHMKVTRVGDDVTLSFTHVDGGAQPPQTYLCTGAPPREGTGIGILGYNGIARIDNFGVPAHPPLNSDGLLYMTSLDGYDPTFAVYDPGADAWTTLNPYETGCQMAVSSAGELYAHNYHTGNIDRYNPATDTWTPLMAGPAGATGVYCNLEITDAGEFLYTEWQAATLWYTSGGSWNTLALPFTGNAMGDYDPLTDQYVVGEAFTTHAHMIDVHTWAITDYISPLPNGENARSGAVLGGRYYFEAVGSNMHSFDLDSPAQPPLDHGVSPGWYTGAAADRFYGVIYNASLDGTELNRFDPATNALTPLTGYGTATWHTSLAFVPGPPMSAQKIAPPFAAPGDVISYTVVISAPLLADGMYMSDTLPLGVAYAGNLTWTHGLAWYDDVDNAVYWEYTAPPPAAPPSAPAPTVYDPASAVDLVGGAEPAGLPPAGLVTPWAYPAAVLWDNGPQVTHPGDCAGMDASRLQTGLGMNTLGFGHQLVNGNRMADDFQIVHPLGWQIDSITFFAYQTDAPSDPSPITGVYMQIWDGPPDNPGSSVVWGDLVTNRLVSSTGVNMQRDSETSPCANNRYVFADVASAGVTLPPGTYWLDWMTDGSLSSGPWAPPITILGQTTTGNALQYTTSSGSWGPANDSGTLTQQGMPFILEGALLEPARVEISFDVTVTAPCGDLIVNEGVAGRGTIVQPFAAATEVWGHSAIAVEPTALAGGLCPDAAAVHPLEICNEGDCPLTWQIYELPPLLARTGSPFVPVTVDGQGTNPGVTTASPRVQPRPVPAAAPEDVLWDQPLSTVNQAAYVDQEFPDIPAYSSFLADDFTNADPWLLESLFIPGDGWSGFSTLMNAAALTWQIYADCAGVPCGDPAGGGNPPVWTLTLPPNHPLVTLSPGTPGGMPSNVLLDLPMPGVLDPGTWWLVFYPTMEFGGFGQYGRQPADTTNGYTAQFINPGEGFGLGPNWQDWTVLAGQPQTDMAFRIEGAVVPLADIPWLSENPLSGIVPPGECRPANVILDAAGLLTGDYFARLLIVSSDPAVPQVIVPVTMTVQGPAEIAVAPAALTAALQPDTTTTRALQVCNEGACPLVWTIDEAAPLRAAAPIPPRREAPSNSDDAAAFPRTVSGNRVLANPVLIIQDQDPWGSTAIPDILTANTIAYDLVDRTQLPTIDLAPYRLVIIPSNQPAAFYAAWNANLARFEDYVSAGGALWLSTCAYSSVPLEPLVPGGVINATDLDEYNDVVDPGHPWAAGVPDPIYGSYASHDSFANLYPGSVVVARAQTSLKPTLVDYRLGAGRILITGQTLEYAWTNGWDGAPILQNSLLDLYGWAPFDIPWLSEDPLHGTVPGGTCQTVVVTFDAAGLTPGDYLARLFVTGNDPAAPEVVVPVTMTVQEPGDAYRIYLPLIFRNN